jgi:hypothetical protein
MSDLAAPAAFPKHETMLGAGRPSLPSVALIASPFISVPPKQYGGTELFVAQLAIALSKLGVKVIVYANGESELPGIEIRSKYARSQWPLKGSPFDTLKNLHATA